MSEPDWIGKGKVRARLLDDGILEATCNGLTTQAKYYKPLFKEFFRKDFRKLRPSYGDFEVHIFMEYTGDPPHMDLDNLSKALLDSLKQLRPSAPCALSWSSRTIGTCKMRIPLVSSFTLAAQKARRSDAASQL